MYCEISYLNIKIITLLQSLSFTVILSSLFIGCGSKVNTESTYKTTIEPIEEVSIREIEENHYSLFTSITIDATTSEVWEVFLVF